MNYLWCSTGSLLMPHLALGKMTRQESIYTSVGQKTYLCPFIVKKTKMVLKQNQPLQYDTHFLGCPTFGESNNLRKLIKKISSELEE
jgi:hypothetical protein